MLATHKRNSELNLHKRLVVRVLKRQESLRRIRENSILVGGIPTPLKNTKVSWDHEVPRRMGKSMFQTTRSQAREAPGVFISSMQQNFF